MLELTWRGITAYDEALAIMAKANSGNVVVGLEHPPTITLGIRGNPEADLKNRDPGIPVYKTTRGGQATIHSPGQLVIYPLLQLKDFGLRPRQFAETFVSSVCETLRECGVQAWSDPERPGVYTARGKIGFLGFRISAGRTTHGLSLNVSNDLSLFDQIRPCGCETGSLTTLENEGVLTTPERVFELWKVHFCQQLGLTRVPSDSNLSAFLESRV